MHQLAKTVSKLCSKAGFKGFFTNHSLRATAATRLYNAGIDEQLVTEKTGHRSNAVRSYKRTSDDQQSAVSSILQGNKCKYPKLITDDIETGKPGTSVEGVETRSGKKLSVKTDKFSFTLDF